MSKAEKKDYDKKVIVPDGTLYRREKKVWVEWDKWGCETWTYVSVSQAQSGLMRLADRWNNTGGNTEDKV